MFMFRSRRNALLKRLWRQAGRCDGADCDADDDDEPGAGVEQPSTESEQQVGTGWIKSAAHALFKRLSDEQLAGLLDALEGAGASSSTCLPLPTDIIHRSSPESVHQIVCRIFRWPDMPIRAELKRMSNLCCQSSSDATVTCCNPHHWCRLSDVAPPPYSRLVLNYDRPMRRPSYTVESMETGGTNQYSTSTGQLDGCGVRRRPWCTLAYWELRQRVGRLFPVTQPSVAIFADATPHRECDSDGLCLGALTAQRAPETDAVRRTRQKVGLGLLLCQESDGVWMYNRSDNAVFVNSPTLDPPGTGPAGAPRTLLVYKVPPSFAIRVFDHERSLLYQQCGSALTVSESLGVTRTIEPEYKELAASEYTDGPFDPNALRISFAKGWGPKYSRQFITSCPCWIEVLLAAPSR